jgi:hypothetical protein
MLKNFMHSNPSPTDPKQPSLTRTDSGRSNHSAQESAKPVGVAQAASAAAATQAATS